MRQAERIRRRNLVLAARQANGRLSNNEGILEVAQLLWKTLDTPLSLGLSLLARNGQLEDLLKVEFQPSRYLDWECNHATDDYQAISFLRKMPLVLPGVSRTGSATRVFWEAERECRETNIRLRKSRDQGDYPPGVGAVLFYAQRKISRVLGGLDARSWALRCRFGPGADHLTKGGRVSPYNKLAEVGSTFDFQSGALALAYSHPAWRRYLQLGRVFRDREGGVTDSPGLATTDSSSEQEIGDVKSEPTGQELDHREDCEISVSLDGLALSGPCGDSSRGNPGSLGAKPVSAEDPLGTTPLELGFRHASGNRVTFVPKTALTDRSIAIEPRMNIYAQLGLGALMRARLKRAGLNLDDQGPNQALAQKGSRDGTVATIDLSSASDTLARELVVELVPEPWLNAMDWCRSKSGRLVDEGGVVTSFRYEKFSSMGNGYTFELESLIFWALATGVCEHLRLTKEKCALTRAYGDDITVPTEAVDLLKETLAFCGFTVNPRKSFSQGVFRESCGADFFNGVNVRPYFQKEFVTDVQGLYRLANGLRRVAYRRNLGNGCDRKLLPVWVHVLQRIPDSLRELKIPFRPIPPPRGGDWVDVESGDGGLASNLDEALSSHWVSFNRDYQRGWSYAKVAPGVVSSKVEQEELFWLFALYAGRDGKQAAGENPLSWEDSTSGFLTSIGCVPQRGKKPVILITGSYEPVWVDLGPWA